MCAIHTQTSTPKHQINTQRLDGDVRDRGVRRQAVDQVLQEHPYAIWNPGKPMHSKCRSSKPQRAAGLRGNFRRRRGPPPGGR